MQNFGYSLQKTQFQTKHLFATGATVQFEWYTGWFLAMGVDSIRGAIQISGGSSSFFAQMAIQTALIRPDNANAGVALGSATNISASTDQSVTTQLAPVSNAPHWFRLGIAYSSNSGTSQGDVGFEASWAQMGSLIDRRRLVLSTDDVISTNDAKILPVTRWFPQKFATKFRIASQLDSVVGTGTLQYQYVAQTAPYTVAVPGNFNATNLTSLTAASQSESATGDVTFSSGNTDMWVRVGVYWYLSATPLTNVILTSTVSVRT